MLFERLPDWERRLQGYIADRRNEPFVMGVNDCVSFARGAIEAMTGADPCPDLTWSSDAEAEALLEQGLETLVSRYLGDPVPVLCVRRGGILLLDHGRGVGVKVGAMAAAPGSYSIYHQEGTDEDKRIFRTEHEGVVLLPLKRFSRGWNV